MSETILVVDDTPANLGVLVETLGAAGYNLMVAEDGEEALAQTAQSAPDLILLDVMMPGIDGFETCRRLKAQPSTADTPVLFMTALSETADKVRAFAAGGVDYITKPIEHEEALARVRTHLALRRLQRELAAEVALKERFMRFAGHDLRNPLWLIMIAAELARRNVGSPEMLAKQLVSIEESVTQMRRVIDTFLGIRSASSPQERNGRVDLALLAKAAIRQHEPAAERKRITFRTEVSEELPLARADATTAYQVLTNLVSNALKFTPPNGEVILLAKETNGRMRMIVIDNGPGVPPPERIQLFQPGVKLTPRPTSGEETSGYGLSIVKQLVDSLGGTVGAEFPASGGSEFWFELPVAK